jgi:hypothetical protein
MMRTGIGTPYAVLSMVRKQGDRAHPVYLKLTFFSTVINPGLIKY